MIKIFKGENSEPIHICVPGDCSFDKATVMVAYQGAVRVFAAVQPGDDLTVSFAADETAVMALGAYPVTVTVFGNDGDRRAVYSGGVKIAVTDCLAEVRNEGAIAIDIRGGLYGISDLPERYTDRDIVAKLREILKRGGAVLGLALLCTGYAFCAGVTVAEKQAIYNDGKVVVDVDFSGLATTNETAIIDTKADNANAAANAALASATNAAATAQAAQASAANAATEAAAANAAANTAKESAHAAEMSVVYAQQTADDAIRVAGEAKGDASNALVAADYAMQEIPHVYDAAASAGDKAEKAQQDVGEVMQIMAGEDFRITVTNYDSKVRAPELSMEARYSDGTTQTWATVWTETNGLARTKRETLVEVKSNHYSKAESDARYKAWSKYDGETGEAAPEGFTQISSPGGIIIGADAGWKNYVSASGGSYWIWRGNGNITTSQETGMLEIIDADGNAVFSVVKGDKTLESAAAASISTTTDGISDIATIVYNVEASEAPVIEWSAELKPAAWYAQTDDGFPGTVVWETENNTKWTATVTLPANGTGFFRATYYKGADSYIRAAKAMAIEKITVGGKTYTLGVGEINGTKVLTLK